MLSSEVLPEASFRREAQLVTIQSHPIQEEDLPASSVTDKLEPDASKGLQPRAKVPLSHAQGVWYIHLYLVISFWPAQVQAKSMIYSGHGPSFWDLCMQ